MTSYTLAKCNSTAIYNAKLGIDPPKLRRDCAGRAVVRAKITGTGIGACTHHAASASGLVPHSDAKAPASGIGWRIHASALRP